MHRYLIFCALLLTGCAEPRVEFIRPEVPDALLTPVSGPSLAQVTTEGDAARVLVWYHRALSEANGKILALAGILGI